MGPSSIRSGLKYAAGTCVLALLIFALYFRLGIRAIDLHPETYAAQVITEKENGLSESQTSGGVSVSTPLQKQIIDGHKNKNVQQTRSTVEKPVNNLQLYPCLPGSVQPGKGMISCVHLFREPTSRTTAKCEKEVTYYTLHGSTPICIYDPTKDIWVSGSFVKGGWESGMVRNAIFILKKNPDMVFFDIGCNIGTYTVAVAKYGRKVIAVDPMLENLQKISYSLHKGNITHNVTLVWNAVSRGREYVTLKKDRVPNIGGTSVRTYDGYSTGDYSYIAEAVTLDDLIPLFNPNSSVFIKMDIEGGELNALLGAQRFFEVLNVKYIQMEILHQKNNAGNMKQIFSLLQKKGVKCYKDVNKRNPIPDSTSMKMPNDVYFIKD